MVGTGFPRAQLIQPGRNTFYAAGNNIGLARVRERYALLLNPDTEVEAGAIDTLAGFLDRHPDTAVVAPQLYHPNGEIQRSCRGFPTPSALVAERMGLSRLWRFMPAFGAYRMAGWNHDTERRVDQPMGTALLVRMAVVDQVGLMDEQFPLFYNEVDWLYRMCRAGWEIWFTPMARVLHHGGSSTRQVRLKASWLSHFALHAFYRKHFKGGLRPLVYGLIVASIYAHGLVASMEIVVRAMVSRLMNRPSGIGK